MGDEKGTKKPKKAKPPKLPGKPPPKDDKAATEKYNALVDFLDCKANKVDLKAGKLDWLGLDVAPPASFEVDPNKPGTINIKVDLGIGTVTLPASVKDGKLEVDTSGLVMGADKVKKFVDDLNNWFEANGRKIDGATVKGGTLTVTKTPPAGAGKAGEKKEEKGVKGGLFPNVPTPEKIGAAVLLGASVLFGVGFMNAGDETETTTEQVCPEPSGPGQSISVVGCPSGQSTPSNSAPASSAPAPRSEGLAEQIGDVIITVSGGQSAPGTITPASGGTLNFQVPLFAIGQSHEVQFRDGGGNPIDSVTFVVPQATGEAPPETTQHGGTVSCFIDHRTPIPPGASGARCTYTQPAVTATPTPSSTPQPAPDTQGQTVEPVEQKTEQETDGAPVSLLAIPGALALGGGALFARNTCRGEKKYYDEYGDDYDYDDEFGGQPPVFHPPGDDKPVDLFF